MINSWERDFPNSPIYGGLAHFDSEAGTTAVIWNDSVITDGGVAVDEYLEEFKRGDFLVRNLLAADPSKGSLAVGAFPRVGQSVQFQIRDGKGASEELEELIAIFRQEMKGKRIYGACLSSCSGRGMGLFGVEHHDAANIYPLITPQAQVGFFGNGEFGPAELCSWIHVFRSRIR